MRAETAAPTTRVFALTTGTLGLLAVGVLILTVTPRRQESPVAVSATTTPAAAVVAVVGVGVDQTGTEPGRRADTRAPAFAPRSVVATTAPTMAPTSTRPPDQVTRALATPIGDGRIAITTRVALAHADGTSVAVVLPSGRHATGEIVETSADTVLVALDQGEPGHEIADHRPSAGDMVVVMTSPPIDIAYGEISTLDVDEGTAVLDRDGDLVGVCSEGRDADHVRLVEITAVHAGATSADR